MPQYTFEYSKISIPPSDPFPNGKVVVRPLLVAHIITDTGRRISCQVWLDSGADQCVFPISFTTLLGLDPLKMKMHQIGGVGSTANATYYEQVTIEIPIDNAPSITFRTYAGFTSGLEAQGIGLLGQSGFFENHIVAFNHKLSAFSIITG